MLRRFSCGADGAALRPYRLSGQKWVERNVALVAPPRKMRGDLYVVFVNPGKGGLMNLDWVEFKE